MKLSLLQFIVRTMSSAPLFLLSFNVKCYLLFSDIYVLLIVSCVVTHEERNWRGEGKFSPFYFVTLKTVP